MMMLTMTVEEIRRNYPPILSLEQVRCILHISKRKAAWLLQNGHIKCTIGEKKTRQYSVPRSELIKYIEKCSEGKAPSVPYGIFSTQKYPSQGRWASICKGAKRSVHNQGMADRLLRSLYEREEPKISHFKIKNTPKASVKYSMLF